MAWWDVRSVFSFINFQAFSQDITSQRLEDSSKNSGRLSHLYFPLIDYKSAEKRMREAHHGSRESQLGSRESQLGSHTVRSHGVIVARTHKHDWLILVLLMAIDIVLNIIHPFFRFVGKDMMNDLKYPLKSNTIPFWAVPIISVLLPMVIFLIFYFRRNCVYDLHHAVLGLLFSVLVTAVITDSIKDAVGRPRPDFFWRCFPDGKDVYNQWGDVICHGVFSIIKEGHKSFPSGHTSWSFAGLGFLSLYLSGKMKVFDRRGHVAKLCVTVFPLLVASLIAVSRVDDYWHHWQDVFVGGLIGFTVATFCYLQFFPPPYHHEGWGPYAYFRVLEESLANARQTDAANHLRVQPEGVRFETLLNQTSNAFNMAIEDLEATGRR